MTSKRILNNRKDVWKILFAYNSLECVIDTINYLEDNISKLDDNIVYTIVSGIFTLYSRIFVSSKSSDVGKLSPKYIPEELKDLHKKIINYRNRIFAHVDPTKPKKPFGDTILPINHIQFNVQDTGIYDSDNTPIYRYTPCSTKSLFDIDKIIPIRDLCNKIIDNLKLKYDELSNACIIQSGLSTGRYAIDLSKESVGYLIKL